MLAEVYYKPILYTYIFTVSLIYKSLKSMLYLKGIVQVKGHGSTQTLLLQNSEGNISQQWDTQHLRGSNQSLA